MLKNKLMGNFTKLGDLESGSKNILILIKYQASKYLGISKRNYDFTI